MNEMLMRGYVTPEDFTGTDGEKLQQALNFAAESDIRMVVLSGDYHADTVLTVPANMYVVLEGTLRADVQCEKHGNFSFEQDRIYLKGGKIKGNLDFYHARHLVLEDLEVDGDVKLEFARDLRLENTKVTGKLTIGRGCANAIAQKLQLGSVELTAVQGAQDIPGREPNVRNIALRDSQVAGTVQITAAEDFGLLNIQADHVKAHAVLVGTANIQLPAERYTNFTLADLETTEGVVLHTPCRNAHIVP